MNLKPNPYSPGCQSGGSLPSVPGQFQTHEERIADLEKYARDPQEKVARLEDLMASVVGVIV